MKRVGIIGLVGLLGLVALLWTGSAGAFAPEKPVAQGGAPTLISYQGRLTDPSTGNPVADGNYSMIFKIYNAQSGGTAVWSETQTVAVGGGLFNVLLGSVNPLSASAFSGPNRWLEVQVGSDSPMIPRQRIASVAYALQAQEAANSDKVDGQDASAFAAAGHNHDDAYLNDDQEETISADVSIGGVLKVENTGTGLLAYGLQGEAEDAGVYGSSPGVGVHGSSQSGVGVYGWSNSGTAISAGGTGIIESVAETHLAINPFEMEPTSIAAVNLFLDFDHHWNGYTEIENTSGTGSRDVYVPVHNLTQLFGTSLKLKSLEVCYDLDSASSYISETRVYYGNNGGGKTEILTDLTPRTSIAWTCYTVSSGSPVTIDGPMLVYFKFYFAGTGSGHNVNIGRMVATLVE